MCIGIPLRVIEAGDGMAVCAGDEGPRTVRTSLLGTVQPGDWLLVFLHDAVQTLDASRAAEIQATLALVGGALHGGAADLLAAFDLPSAQSADALRALTS